MAGEYIEAFIIDNHEFNFYTDTIRMTPKGIAEHVQFDFVCLQKRYVDGVPFNIICENYLKDGFYYHPSTYIDDKPDILGSIIVTGITQKGKPCSLTSDDIDLLQEFLSVRYTDGVIDKYDTIYTLSVTNPDHTTNIQTKYLSQIPLNKPVY